MGFLLPAPFKARLDTRHSLIFLLYPASLSWPNSSVCPILSVLLDCPHLPWMNYTQWFQVLLFQGETVLVSSIRHLAKSSIITLFSISKVIILFPFQLRLSQNYDDWVGLSAFMHFFVHPGQSQWDRISRSSRCIFDVIIARNLPELPKIMTSPIWILYFVHSSDDTSSEKNVSGEVIHNQLHEIYLPVLLLHFINEKIGGQGYSPSSNPSMAQVLTNHQMQHSFLSILIFIQKNKTCSWRNQENKGVKAWAAPQCLELQIDDHALGTHTTGFQVFLGACLAKILKTHAFKDLNFSNRCPNPWHSHCYLWTAKAHNHRLHMEEAFNKYKRPVPRRLWSS